MVTRRRQLEIDRTREALATHLRRCSENSSSYFFTINGDYRHPFSLANLCGADDHKQWRALLVSADLASIYQKGINKNKMKIKTDEWDEFIADDEYELNELVEIIRPTKFDAWLRYDGQTTSPKTEYHQLRIGNKLSNSPKKIGDQIDKSTKKMNPPVISANNNNRRLKSWQSSLRRNTQYDTLDSLSTLGDSVDDNSNKSNKKVDKPQDSLDDTTAVRSGVDDSVESPQKRQKTSTSSKTNTISPDKNTSASEYPHLKNILGDPLLDCNDGSTLNKVNEVLLEVLQFLGHGSELTVTQSNNRVVHYIKVPQNTSDSSFKHYAKSWIEPLIEVSGGDKDDCDHASRRLAEYLIKNHRSAVVNALRNTNSIPICKPMSAIQYASMCQKVNINTSGQKELSKHLRDHLGNGFTPTRQEVDKLSEGYTPIITKTIEYIHPDQDKEETIEFSEKDLVLEMTTQLARALQSKQIHPDDVKRVTNVSGGDKGGDAFQFGCKIKVEFHNGAKAPMFVQISVAELICQHDTADLIEKTILPNLTKGLKTVATEKLHIYLDNNGKVNCQFGNPPPQGTASNIKTLNKVRLFITGDLAFYAMALGRESMSGHWCYLCMMRRKQFSDVNQRADPWTMDKIVEVAEEVAGKKPKMGVKQKPWWPFIPLQNYIIPLLHVLIGIGNDLLSSFRDWVNDEIESLDQQEVRTRRAVHVAEHKIIDTIVERDDWDDAPDGKALKSLKNRIKYRANKLKELGALFELAQDTSTNANSPGQEEFDEFMSGFDSFVDGDGDEDGDDDDDDEEEEDEQITSVTYPPNVSEKDRNSITKFFNDYKRFVDEKGPLQSKRDEITKRLKTLRTYLRGMKSKLVDFRKVRKISGEGLESKMFKVLKEVGVELESYHGGSLNGKDIIKVADNCDYIFERFKNILVEGKKQGCELNDDAIKAKCDEFKRTFLLWDGAFSYTRKVNPTEDDMEMCNRFVKAAVDAHKDTGCSITHKVHLMLCHVVWQMQLIDDGLGDYMEDWIELAHQIGARIRNRWRRVHKVSIRDVGRAKSEFVNTHPDVVAYGDGVADRSKRIFKVSKESVKVKRKEERMTKRMSALNQQEEKIALQEEKIALLCELVEIA